MGQCDYWLHRLNLKHEGEFGLGYLTDSEPRTIGRIRLTGIFLLALLASNFTFTLVAQLSSPLPRAVSVVTSAIAADMTIPGI